MTVGKLKELLRDAPDYMQVLIPGNALGVFDGAFFSPCEEDTGIGELGLENLTEDEENERKLIGQEIKTDKAFVLVPCGFFQEHDRAHELN